jgi:uncharacterized membrane protein YoaK (UPF0700 family)
MRKIVKDAWTTLVPNLQDRHGPLPPFLVLLTVVTGMVDAFSYLVLGHVFVANMTGNVVFIAFSLAGSPDFSLLASTISLLAFAVGALIGGRVGHHTRVHRGKQLLAISVVETVLLLGSFLYTSLTDTPFTAATRYTLIILLGLTMGAQNAVARRLAVPDLTTTVLTLTITGIAADSRLAGGQDSKSGRRLLSGLSMFVGALIGALLILHANQSLTLLTAGIILALCAVGAIFLARSRREWTNPIGR